MRKRDRLGEKGSNEEDRAQLDESARASSTERHRSHSKTPASIGRRKRYPIDLLRRSFFGIVEELL
jgi:hypothetical protein